jgi:carboxymethylenebutenolidase
MSITAEWVRFGERTGYLAIPERAIVVPGVLVLQEIWGVDAHIQDVTRRLAGAGYAALAPDLFAPAGTRPDALAEARCAETQAFLNRTGLNAWTDHALREAALAALPADQSARISETIAAFQHILDPGGPGMEPMLPIVADAARHLCETFVPTRGQKLGAIGFCMGGGVAARAACRAPSVTATVMFYGPPPPDEELPQLAGPILALHASHDARLVPTIAPLAGKLAKLGKSYESKIYEGAQHAFFNDGRPSYHAGAARDAWARTLMFFNAHLA